MRRKPQETADFRRKPQKTADFRRNRFLPFAVSLLARPYTLRSDPFGAGKSHQWTNTSLRGNFDELSASLVHTNLAEYKAEGAIGPYEFPLKLIWTNGSQIQEKHIDP